jgi:hypothetical protein
VETEVDSGRGARRRQHVAVVDEQLPWIDVDRRIALGQRRCVHPVGRRRTAVQQAGRREHEGAGAQPDDAGALLVGPAQRVERLLRWWGGDRTPGRHDDRARP